ncbi:MAG: DNA starvation/stationary phase protection protein [bacterium]|nr:DNA starvation/stationary phase protection protein [bacterium]
MKPNIGISEKKLNAVAELISEIMANEILLYTKTRKFHWNVSGESFMELHKLFQSQYNTIEENIDLLAERTSKLGVNAIGTMSEFLKLATLKEHPGKYPESKDMLKELLQDHEIIIVQLRENIEKCTEKFEDVGTSDFLTGLIQEHESMAWILRRYLS